LKFRKCRVDIVLVSPLQSTRRESKILRATKRCTKSTVKFRGRRSSFKYFHCHQSRR